MWDKFPLHANNMWYIFPRQVIILKIGAKASRKALVFNRHGR